MKETLLKNTARKALRKAVKKLLPNVKIAKRSKGRLIEDLRNFTYGQIAKALP